MKKTQRKHKRKKRDGFRETTVGNEDVRHIDGQYSISAEIWRWQNKIRLHKINKIKKKIREMDVVSRQKNSELYIREGHEK